MITEQDNTTRIRELNDASRQGLGGAGRLMTPPDLSAAIEALRLCERALEERNAEAEAYAVKKAREVIDHYDAAMLAGEY